MLLFLFLGRQTSREALVFILIKQEFFFSIFSFFFLSYSNDPHPPQHARLAARLLVDKQQELQCWKLQGNISASSV